MSASVSHSATGLAGAEGARAANEAIAAIRGGTSDPDLMLRTILRCAAGDGCIVPPTDRLRAACRQVQKSLEQGARP